MIFLIIISPVWGAENIDSLQNLLKKQLHFKNKVAILDSIIAHYYQSEPQKALPYIVQMENITTKNELKTELVQSYIYKSIAFAQLGELEKSNKIALKAVKFANRNQIDSVLPRIYLTIGINYLRLSENDKAIRYLLKTKEVSKKEKNKEMIANVNITLGLFKKNNNELQEAVKYLKEAEAFFKSINDKNSLCTIYTNLTGVYLDLLDTLKAQHYNNKAIDYSTQQNDERSLAIAYNNKAVILAGYKEYDNAIEYVKKSIEIKEKQRNIVGLANSYIVIANIYILTKKYNYAIEYLQKAEHIFKSAKMIQLQMGIYLDLEKIYTETGDYKSAYKYTKLAQAINDTLFSENKLKLIEEYTGKYNIAEKEKEKQLVIRETEKQKFFITIILIALISVFIIAVMFSWKIVTTRKANKLLAEKQKTIEKQNQDLRKLVDELHVTNKSLHELNAVKDKFFSIIAHDLKSPISTLNQLVKTINNDYKEFSENERIDLLRIIEDSSTNTFNLLQNLLTWARTQQKRIEFNPEIASISQIIENTINPLKHTAEDKKIEIINYVNENSKANVDVNLFSTIIRNLVSNSIKYTKPNGKITISLENDNENEFVIKVSDNGVGINQKTIVNLFKIDKTTSTPGTNHELGTGLGLILCKEFAEKHGGKIWVESEPGKGSSFYFSIKK